MERGETTEMSNTQYPPRAAGPRADKSTRSLEVEFSERGSEKKGLGLGLGF